MNTFWTTLKQMAARVGAALPPVAAAPVTYMIHDHCPHCEERTLWQVNVLHRYHRCMKCGEDPMRHFSSWRRSGSSTEASERWERIDRDAKEPDNSFEDARCRVK